MVTIKGLKNLDKLAEEGIKFPNAKEMMEAMKAQSSGASVFTKEQERQQKEYFEFIKRSYGSFTELTTLFTDMVNLMKEDQKYKKEVDKKLQDKITKLADSSVKTAEVVSEQLAQNKIPSKAATDIMMAQREEMGNLLDDPKLEKLYDTALAVGDIKKASTASIERTEELKKELLETLERQFNSPERTAEEKSNIEELIISLEKQEKVTQKNQKQQLDYLAKITKAASSNNVDLKDFNKKTQAAQRVRAAVDEVRNKRDKDYYDKMSTMIDGWSKGGKGDVANTIGNMLGVTELTSLISGAGALVKGVKSGKNFLFGDSKDPNSKGAIASTTDAVRGVGKAVGGVGSTVAKGAGSAASAVGSMLPVILPVILVALAGVGGVMIGKWLAPMLEKPIHAVTDKIKNIMPNWLRKWLGVGDRETEEKEKKVDGILASEEKEIENAYENRSEKQKDMTLAEFTKMYNEKIISKRRGEVAPIQDNTAPIVAEAETAVKQREVKRTETMAKAIGGKVVEGNISQQQLEMKQAQAELGKQINRMSATSAGRGLSREEKTEIILKQRPDLAAKLSAK